MEISYYVDYIKNNVLETPAYVFNCQVLKNHINNIYDIIDEKIHLCYAMKANPFLVPYLDKMVDTIEVCSSGELNICKRFGIPAKNIVFSGVNKTKTDIKNAFEYGVGTITIESYNQFLLINQYCKEKNCEANVFLRLSDGAQFGMNEEVLEQIVKNRKDYKYLHIIGIHFFSGTQKRKININELKMIIEYVNKLKRLYNLEIQYLEYGVGLYVPYFVDEDADRLYDELKEIATFVKDSNLPYIVVFEMGRFFTAICGEYLTTIEDMKVIEDKNYCIVDGGIHHLNYFGQNMAMRTPIIQKIDISILERKSILEDIERKDMKWIICGSLCTYADILARNVLFDKLSIGDILIFQKAGAYSVTETPGMFLSREMPSIYLYEKEHGLTKVRERIPSDQFITNMTIN